MESEASIWDFFSEFIFRDSTRLVHHKPLRVLYERRELIDLEFRHLQFSVDMRETGADFNHLFIYLLLSSFYLVDLRLPRGVLLLALSPLLDDFFR